MELTPPATPDGRDRFGRCYESWADDVDISLLGKLPTLGDIFTGLGSTDDDEFGNWQSAVDERGQVAMPLHLSIDASYEEIEHGGKVIALHATMGGPNLMLNKLYDLRDMGLEVGILLEDLVQKSEHLSEDAERYALGLLATTTKVNSQAADNYARMGDYMEGVHERGGFKNISRSVFMTITEHLVSRWTTAREATAAARIAASLVYNDRSEKWSPAMFEEAMEEDSSEEEKQAKLLSMAGMVFKDSIGRKLEERRRRSVFTAWRADALAPAKAFCRAFDVDDEAVEKAFDSAAAKAVPALLWAKETLAAAALPAAKVMATVAAGGAVSATLLAAAGLALDWYYDDVSDCKLGPDRHSYTEEWLHLKTVHRAKQLFSVGAAVSDDVYDCSSHTQVIRVDPFFFSVRSDMARMKDDSAAQRMLTNALVPPLIQNVTTADKTVVKLPGTISEESARHIQEAMPEFYFRIVNRNHSHPELWAVRRGFEMMVARSIFGSDAISSVIMVGGNVRQVSKIPNVVANFGPEMSGRDESRHRLKGTSSQRQLFNRLNIPKKFEDGSLDFAGACVVSFYATQRMSKRKFMMSCVKQGVTRGYVAMNIPVIMMDHRIEEWDDHILNIRYTKEQGGDIKMSPLQLPVAGYSDSFAAVMSWVKPMKPIYGYDVTVSALSQVGSSYLLEFEIGTGNQEAYDTIWRMPDAGYYVLHDLTRDSDGVDYFTVPVSKFDMTVKYVVQLSGAKNVVEAVSGRVLGLEAQIKLGGNVLERAWQLSHRHFVSVVIHAITCAGVDKSDSLVMLRRLQSHFTDPTNLGLLSRVLNGYTKLLGMQRDVRLPGKARRGASDYDAVTHWTSHQCAGHGFGEVFPNPPCDNPGGDTGVGKGVSSDLKDEGYVSAESLNEDDEDRVGTTPAGDSIVEKMMKWAAPTPTASDRPLKPDNFSQRVRLDEADVVGLRTDSTFEPEAPLVFGVASGSMCDDKFRQQFASENDVGKALVRNEQFCAPDAGLVRIVQLALERPRRLIAPTLSFQRELFTGEAKNAMDELYSEFLDEVDDGTIVSPSLLIDGIAGSAKSSVVRAVIRMLGVSTAVVVPTRKLAKDWRKHKVGTVVTRHKLKLTTLRGRKLLVVDEAYDFSKGEMHAILRKAALHACQVLLLGDRNQQYEDGGEITYADFSTLGMPTVRMLVSNTMPCDAVKIARWACQSDEMRDMFQTRSKITHSVWFKQRDQLDDVKMIKDAVASEHCLVFKDRAPAELQYTTLTDTEAGFAVGQEEEWLSTSRVQGARSKDSLLLTSRFTKAEKWYANQPGLLYVATSRHSRSMVMLCEQSDLSFFSGLVMEAAVTVQSRLTASTGREKFESPYFVLKAVVPKSSPVLNRLASSGLPPQCVRFVTGGQIREDWRPWARFNNGSSGSAFSLLSAATGRLVGEQVPFVNTESAKRPEFPAAMGLWSMRRPEVLSVQPVRSAFEGMDRLAVLQNSKDELLDLKNVVERTARPRTVERDPMTIRLQSEILFSQMKKFLFRQEGEVNFGVEPQAEDWANSRTADFAVKLTSADYYGVTAYSTRSQGFLKTQTKVKLKREFALEENYGQTVLASPADFNAMFGPYSKMFLRNVRLVLRDGVIADTGFSDRELARLLRSNGALASFSENNYQADVKRQDTSHNPVTLRVFCMVMEYLGVPKELCDIYEKHSAAFEYQSMKSGLYRGLAEYNLGSGDPFTLIRNIFEVFTVLIERFGSQTQDATIVVKGDDCLADRLFRELPVFCPDVRATQLTEDWNAPPYHAGRFFLPDDIVPDPVRMVAKIMVKQTEDPGRLAQLAESFYDRYIHLTPFSYNLLQKYVLEAYDSFEPEFALSALEFYHALRDRNLFSEVMFVGDTSRDDRLVILNSEDDCIRRAASLFCSDEPFLETLVDQDHVHIQAALAQRGIPVHMIRGKPNDLLRRGVWLSPDHAWAVVGLTEYENYDTETLSKFK